MDGKETITVAAEETASVDEGKRDNAAAVEAAAAVVMTPIVIAAVEPSGDRGCCLSAQASHLLCDALTFRAAAGRVACMQEGMATFADVDVGQQQKYRHSLS
jgi:hypothetical protein